MRLAILLGLILSWAVGVGSQALAHPTSDDAGASALLWSSAQPVTPTITLSEPVGPIITSTASSTITATVATTATETITSTSTPAGPPPPTVAVPVVDTEIPLQINPFDANFLFSKASPPMGPFAWACFALMVILLVVSGYFYAVKRPQWKRNNSVLYRAANRFSQPGMWLAILGLLLVLFRIVGLDFFDKRFWLYLWLLSVIGVGVWLLYWYRARYPKELEKFRKTQRAKQYMPGGSVRTPVRQPERTPPKPAPQPRPAPKPSGSTPSPRPSGDKKRGKGR
ncbi:MAG TPA: hypothetical protein VJ183_14270 [Chloroflexia bacterium]|nr:hypothetical protein [Chloroflexia bacterium]